MFVDDKAFIKISVYYKTVKGKHGIRVEANLDKIPEAKRADWQSVVFDMRQLTWKMSNDLMRECRSQNMATGVSEIDWISYKERKLKMTIAAWDVKDDKGNPVSLNEVAIMKMHPLIAETLLSQYDKESYLSEEE